MNPLFQGVQANDAKDLVNFIIMTLHEELNMGQKLNTGNINMMNQPLINKNPNLNQNNYPNISVNVNYP